MLMGGWICRLGMLILDILGCVGLEVVLRRRSW